MSVDAPETPEPEPPTKSEIRQSRIRAALFVLAPLAVALIAIAVFRATNDAFEIGLGQGLSGLDPEAEGYWDLLAAERRARLLWESSIVCLIAVSLAAIVIALWMICAATVARERQVLLGCLGGLLAVMVGFILVNDVSLELTRDAVLEPTVGRALALSNSSFTLEHFETSRRITNAVSTAATVALVFAIIAVTQLGTAATATLGFEARMWRLAEQVHRLRTLLYVSAAVLVTLILSMAAWLLWPISVAGTPEMAERLEAVASGIGLYWGTSFTLVLAASYLPSAMVLGGRVRALGRLTEEQSMASLAEQRRQTLERLGLTESVFAPALRLVAILSPLLTGTLPFLEAVL